MWIIIAIICLQELFQNHLGKKTITNFIHLLACLNKMVNTRRLMDAIWDNRYKSDT